MYNVYTNHSMLQFGSSQHEDAKIPILNEDSLYYVQMIERLNV